MKIALGIEYNGSAFHGWQAQKDGVRTVQTSLEAALSKVANHPVRVTCAGRTDTGVHALGQVVNFETDALRSEHNWMQGANTNLPYDVSVAWARPVSDDFSARFSAVSRRYRYFILNRISRSSVLSDRVTWSHRPLDEKSMHQAAQALVGQNDFSSYRALACQAKSPVRTMHSIEVERRGEIIEIRLHANAFLHHMVRNIAGVLMSIGRGEQSVDWAAEILAFKDRTKGGVTAPPHGLYFEQVEYPEEFEIPAPVQSGFPA